MNETCPGRNLIVKNSSQVEVGLGTLNELPQRHRVASDFASRGCIAGFFYCNRTANCKGFCIARHRRVRVLASPVGIALAFSILFLRFLARNLCFREPNLTDKNKSHKLVKRNLFMLHRMMCIARFRRLRVLLYYHCGLRR